jgi:hypothetical protein
VRNGRAKRAVFLAFLGINVDPLMIACGTSKLIDLASAEDPKSWPMNSDRVAVE